LEVLVPKRPAPYGSTVSGRNGAKIVLSAPEAAEFELPEHVRLCEAAQADWDALWRDPVSQAVTPSSRALLVRWIDALNRYYVSTKIADADPVVCGSKIDNPRPNPHYKIAADALVTVKSCEYQLGIGARNQVGLGMAIAGAKEKTAPAVEGKPRRAIASVTRIDPREESTG